MDNDTHIPLRFQAIELFEDAWTKCIYCLPSLYTYRIVGWPEETPSWSGRRCRQSLAGPAPPAGTGRIPSSSNQHLNTYVRSPRREWRTYARAGGMRTAVRCNMEVTSRFNNKIYFIQILPLHMKNPKINTRSFNAEQNQTNISSSFKT